MENLLQVKPVNSQEKVNANQYAREVLVVLFINTLVCTLVAVVVWLAFPVVGQHGLFSCWVYSQSVGQTICIGSLVYSHTLRKYRVHSRLYYYLGCCLIVPFGFVFGENMAATILSYPATTPQDGHIFWTSLLVTIFVSVFSILFYGTWHHVTTLKLAAAKESARASKAKLSMLQAQVEPHMLFNTLSNLRTLIESDPQKAEQMLDHLVDYLRATLAGSQNDSATMKEEFELLKNYLSLMEIRMGNRLSFDLKLPAELTELKVPVLILQPIVENAIKHGLEPTVAGGHISVQARIKDAFVAVDILDTGVGYMPGDQQLSKGFGLHSVRDRLQTADHAFDVLSISSPPKSGGTGTLVTVRFPLSKRLKPQSHSL